MPFYDIGAGSLSASVIEVVSTVKTGLTTAVHVLLYASERGVNGWLLDGVIIDTLTGVLNDLQEWMLVHTRGQTTARFSRLRKESQRAREYTVLKTQLYKAECETTAKPMIDLVGLPAKAALSSQGLHPVTSSAS